MKKSSLVAVLSVTVVYCILICSLFLFRKHGESVFFRPDRLAQLTATVSNNDSKHNTSIIHGKININTATAEELTLLPGIGDSIAKRIIEFRNNSGNFLTINDLLKVKGIGEKKLEQISDYISIGGK